MKKIIALLLVAVMAIGFCACAAKTETPAEPATTETTTTEATETTETTEPAAEETTTEETTTEETTENQHFDKLTLEFVPSKDADVIITGTKNLPELVKAEMSKLGYDIDEVDITVGTSYDATGEAMSAGTIDLGWLPGGTYALYSDDVDVILTATRNGLSNDSTNPADWNGEANATKKDGPQVTYYRSLIYATPSPYGKELAAKVNAGEALTWEDVSSANWSVANSSSPAGYIYPSLWLQENFDKNITDLPHAVQSDSYGSAFARLASGQVDILCTYADARRDYEDEWTTEYGMTNSIWDDTAVVGVTPAIYNDTISVSKTPPIMDDDFKQALGQAFINIGNTEEGKEVIAIYSHNGYQWAKSEDYDSERAAQEMIQSLNSAG